MDKTERLLDLVALFLDATHPVTWDEIRDAFPDEYAGSDDATQRKFERDKAELLELGIPLTFVQETDETPAGYVLDREETIQLSALEASADSLADKFATKVAATLTLGDAELAARELATHGRLATSFALPLERTRHAVPPWPLAVVQPGLVLAEAALFRMAPKEIRLGGTTLLSLSRPDEREWLALVLPFCCFILIGLLLAVVASRLLYRL